MKKIVFLMILGSIPFGISPQVNAHDGLDNVVCECSKGSKTGKLKANDSYTSYKVTKNGDFFRGYFPANMVPTTGLMSLQNACDIIGNSAYTCFRNF